MQSGKYSDIVEDLRFSSPRCMYIMYSYTFIHYTVSIVVVVVVSFATFAFKMISFSPCSWNCLVSHDQICVFFFLRSDFSHPSLFIVPQDWDFSEKLLRLI